MAQMKNLILTLKEPTSDSITDLLPQLEQHEFRVGSVLEILGVVTGSAPESAIAALQALPQIEAVREDQEASISPVPSPTDTT